MATTVTSARQTARLLSTYLRNKEQKNAFKKALEAQNGDIVAALESLRPTLDAKTGQTLAFVHALAVWSDNNAELMKIFAQHPKVASLRDVAVHFDEPALAQMLPAKAIPDGIPGDTAAARARSYAATLHTALFRTQTSGVLRRMLSNGSVPSGEEPIRSALVAFFDRHADFDIRRTSIYKALSAPDALADVPAEKRASVVEHLKALQRVQAVAPTPAAMAPLLKANLTAALHISQIPEAKFVASFSDSMGADTARQVYTNAVNARIRNEHALMTLREAARGSGLSIIDGPGNVEQRKSQVESYIQRQAVPLNLENLFGSLDECECAECLSVFSPAAYFVELLQYVRNNDLDPANSNTGVKGIAGTPLELLFRRRPDLGCIELTCENTYTVLPYIDLGNEVMESFIVHANAYHSSSVNPKQAVLDAFNVGDESSDDLLAQPQHINWKAYCLLKNAVYPFSLPYHQPIDAARIFLKYMGTSRYQLLEVFRSATENVDVSTFSAADQATLKTLHRQVLHRATQAEYLTLTQEEYIILTREAFWPKHYFELSQTIVLSDAQYQSDIGVVPVYQYFGYANAADMLDIAAGHGLTYVKAQFLPRTGIQYADLVALLQTRSINPNFPQGKALELMQSIHFSYRFLQTLVDTSTNDKELRYAVLIDFLNQAEAIVPKLIALLHPDPCHARELECCSEEQRAIDFKRWVLCYFERIGQLIVLESNDGPTLAIYGDLYRGTEKPVKIGTLLADGTIENNAGAVIGHITADLKLIDRNGKPLNIPEGTFVVAAGDPSLTRIGFFAGQTLETVDEKPVAWREPADSCDLSKVRLVHLDGSPVSSDEYDRLHRFIRLWRNLGWAIDEVDQALLGAADAQAPAPAGPAPAPVAPASAPAPALGQFIGFDAFEDDCSDVPDTNNDCGCGDRVRDDKGGGGLVKCPDEAPVVFDINPKLIDTLVDIQKLLKRTALPLNKLLCFWTDIDTRSDQSLYATLFLSPNMLGLDSVFKADPNGEYLTTPASITDHVPVLMAALRLKADDIATIMTFRSLADSLTLANVSALYRHSLLAQLLKAKVADLPRIIGLLGDPFVNAPAALGFLRDWSHMREAGFSFDQLDYLVAGTDNPLRPLSPQMKVVLQLGKTLYDGLNQIVTDQPDFNPSRPDLATDDAVRAETGLLFDAATVEQIVGLLDGSSKWTTNAPLNLTVNVPVALAAKLQYTNLPKAVPPSATLQLTGILTPNEMTLAQPLSNDPNWIPALNRASKQAVNFFNDVLSGIFTDMAAVNARLLNGDVIVPADQIDYTNPIDPNTAPAKRLYFLGVFMPFLRQQLQHRLIVQLMAGAAALDADVTDALLSSILTAGVPKQPALQVLSAIQTDPAPVPGEWQGYLLAPASASFTFFATSTAKPSPLLLNGTAVPFAHQQDDPDNVWWTDAVPLKSATLYAFEIDGMDLSQVEWKTNTSARAAIPASSLLPDYSASAVGGVLTKLYQSAILINGFSLRVAEVNYLQIHGTDFAGFDFNQVTLNAWRSCRDYCTLRDTLPTYDTTLLDLFGWAGAPDDPTHLSAHIAAATGWDKVRIDALLESSHFDLGDPVQFKNAEALILLKKAVGIADKTAMDIDSLFTWANPSSQFWVCHTIADNIHKALRSRFSVDDWDQVVKPLNDELRQHQQAALVAYLLVNPDLVAWGVEDADSLFEFFLIDVQMCACLETSRIKQAISSVQTFVQRCFMGLESPEVASDTLDRTRWTWMARNTLWLANRQIFVYPENWIRTDLRDDKSVFYQELEGELLQKDINVESVEDALKTYLFKVDDVAHLQVLGLFEDKDNQKMHVFARSHGAPYHFYYRYFDQDQGNWYPWEPITVDIPSYDLENTWQVQKNGCYLTPAVWHNRLLLFFPQITKKSAASQSSVSAKKDNGNFDVAGPPAPQFWEIKLGWTEYRNGKWTQKQLSKDCFNTAPGDVAEPGIASFALVPYITADGVTVLVYDVTQPANALASFVFLGSQVFTGALAAINAGTLPDSFQFYSGSDQLHSLQLAAPDSTPEYEASVPYFQAADGTQQAFSVTLANYSNQTFYHPFSHQLLGTLNLDTLDNFFDYFSSQLTAAQMEDAFGAYPVTGNAKSFHELKRPYALYNWELAFHTPMALMNQLAANQQFDDALVMANRVFDPAAPGTGASRFWNFPPFKLINSSNTVDALFQSLAPDQPNSQINEWRDNPFEPHVVARSRPSAYMKWTVMQYIQVLIDTGDYYFRQPSLEAVPTALQYYILASHIYGPRLQRIPKRGTIQPQTYQSLLDQWDAFGNAMVELELAFPFSNQIATAAEVDWSNKTVGFADIFGFATSLYFCVPLNPELLALRDTIDDRLFKIRHCEDINGVVRQLPLFDAPIDPGLLVEAEAQGLSLASVLNDLNSPVPNYRFFYLLQKALELCNEVKAFGASFLEAQEKGDAETLAALRASQETAINTLVMQVRQQQADEAQATIDQLEANRQAPVVRLQHYLQLIGQDQSNVPGEDSDFNAIADPIDAPVDDSGLELSPLEAQEMLLAKGAADLQKQVGQLETLASILNLIPNFSVNIQPVGVGASVSFGGSNVGAAIQAMARNLQTVAGDLTYQSTNAGRKAAYQRQLQERVLQANIAGYEIKNIDKQILAQKIRLSIAQQEIVNQQKLIDNAQTVQDFLTNKFTNADLYAWMQDSLSGLYYQAYTLAYDLGKRAEKLFHFERGAVDKTFIAFGYWDASRQGLLAGHKLYVGLKNMEAAYLANRGYDFEVTHKPISLRQLSPMALLALRETGTCQFSVPEVLFDMDFPGHYLRRIKSIAVTIPCVVGPYTSVNCTLRLLEHSYRVDPTVQGAVTYPQSMDPDNQDTRFTTTNVPISAVALSTGQNDSGLFEFSFKDERYLPFEGAGAISKWSLSLPAEFRQFDYDTITDVILNMGYTALDGGEKLGVPAGKSVLAFIQSVQDLSQDQGLFAAFDLRHDFPNEWYKAVQTGGAAPTITLQNVYERLPIFTKGHKPAKIQATDINLLTGSDSGVTGVSVTQGGNANALTAADAVGDLSCFNAAGLPGIAMDTWQVNFQGKNFNLDTVWMVVRYVLL